MLHSVYGRLRLAHQAGNGERHCNAIVVEHLAPCIGGPVLTHAENVVNPVGF
jgi:hypothetical protein